MERVCKGKNDDHDAQDAANRDPRLELSKPCPGGLDDIAHDGVVERVENPRRHHDDAKRRELRARQILCKQHVREQVAAKHPHRHVAPD